MRARLCGAVFVVLTLVMRPAAQSMQPPAPADFGQWERLVTSNDHGGLSPDGRWLAYAITRSNRENELRVASIADGTTKMFPFGTQPTFSSDSRWLACALGVSEAQDAKLRKEKKPVHRKLGLLNLATGESTTLDGIESFAFSADGSRLLMRRYAPEPPSGGAAKEPDPSAALDPDDTPGATAIVRELASGRDTTFGNVGEYAWQSRGRLLVLTIAAEDRAGNAVQVFDPKSGQLRVLDSAPARYLGAAWRKDADDLVVLRSKADEHRDGATYTALAWIGVDAVGERKHQYDPTGDTSFPSGMRTVAFRRPSWSDDGSIVFVGLTTWPEKAAPGKKEGGAADEDEPASVDIWHARDVDVMPKQKVNAKRDRERSLLAAWHVDSGRLVQLGRDLTEQVTPLKKGHTAYVTNWKDTAFDRSIGRYGAELWLEDMDSGERTKVVDRVDDRFLRASPDGRYLLYYKDGQYWTVDVARRATTNITKGTDTSFADRESDSTDPTKPSFGVGGWTKEDALLLYDKFDIWEVSPDGQHSLRLTDGAAEQTRYRYDAVDPEEESVDRSKAVFLGLFGVWNKKSGFARLAPGAAAPEKLVWLDRDVDRLAKAKKADVYQYVVQAYDESPNAFVAGPDLKNAKRITATNPFQSRFAWGRSELVEFKSERGTRLQGVLRYPANYEAGTRYPMVVYVYERRSDSLHQYSAPSERDYYSAATFTSAGYFFFEPDIVFRPREPGLSVVECVRPAVDAVVQSGVVDGKRVGIVGHSWGGFDTAYLATHTDIFAAAVAGAPITDLVSNYGNHHWGPGIAETDHIETGQQRMVVPLWEDVAAYTRNSAVFNVQSMTTPLLIEVGDADGTVFWHQGVELYNVARRAKKDVVLLVYANEDHGLRQKSNQIDYHRRIMQWFGHYLKGEPAPSWITTGMTYLDKERAAAAAKKKGTN